MEITVSQEQARVSVTVLRVTGEIDASTADAFLAAASKAVDGGARSVLLDLTQTHYISSAGLRALNSLFVWLRDASGDDPQSVSRGLRDGTFRSPHLKLLNPSPDVLKVLSTAGFDMFLECFTDRQTAVAAF